ncbi:MAG: phage integrase SAM-like domain-containing protein [Chitinophagaceae bacterium]|nr:phage integrase SAM-like domain-containing protein [Chitinophagaceae bacterium]
MDRVIYSADMIIERLKADKSPTTKKEAPSNILFDFIDKYVEEHKATTREAGSLTVYRTLKKHLQGYQQDTNRKVTFDKIDYSFFQSFQNYLLSLTSKLTGYQCLCSTIPQLQNS